MTIDLVLLGLGLICLFLAAIDFTVSPRISLGWLGLFFLFGRGLL